MNPRKPIIAMMALGVIIIVILASVPYTLTLLRGAGHTLSSSVSTPAETGAARELSGQRAAPPLFDVASWYAARDEEPEWHGVLIEDMAGQRVYASHNSETPFNPASLIKLATSLLALRRLGPDYRFETRVFVEGEPDSGGVLRGKLYVAGSDPTFGDVAANLIARELKARGITRLADGVVVSPDFCFNYSDLPEESGRRLIRVMRLGEEKTLSVGAPPAGAPLFAIQSYPLRDVLLYMNAHSTNFIAERVGGLVGGAGGVESFLVNELQLPADKTRLATTSGRESNHMTPSGVIRVIRALHEEAQKHGMKLEDLMPVASDDAGTLRRRLAGTPLEGAIIGKTGTLTAEVDGGMASLAGVVYTKQAGMIVFAILDQGNRIWENRQMEDQLLVEIITTQDLPVPIAKESQRKLLPASSLQVIRLGAGG